VLWVRVTTAAWMNELSLLAPTLLQRLNAVPGRTPVRQLRFRLGKS
jgi:Dna[CI] antecedent, DciA